MLRFDVGEDLLHYYCNVDRVTVYATAPVNVAVGARILRQIGAGARDGGQEPRAGSIELAEASYRAAIGETVAVPRTRRAVDRSAAVPEHERRRHGRGHHYRPVPYPPALRDRPQFEAHLQRPSCRCKAGRPRVGRALCAIQPDVLSNRPQT
jgi:hypothetical protein